MGEASSPRPAEREQEHLRKKSVTEEPLGLSSGPVCPDFQFLPAWLSCFPSTAD